VAPVLNLQFFKAAHISVAKATKEYHTVLKRHAYVTPTSYLELLSTFKSLLKSKRQSLKLSRERIRNGLAKLTTTASQVAVLQVRRGLAMRRGCLRVCCVCHWCTR
jgi:dynein heavy chain